MTQHPDSLPFFEDPKAIPDAHERLRQLFEYADPTQWRHAAVDVQRRYASAESYAHIDAISFRLEAFGIGTDWIFWADLDDKGRCDERHNAGPEKSDGGVWKTIAGLGPEDTLRPKFALSAFNNTTYDRDLKRQNMKVLIVTGFDLDSCVAATIIDALRLGYEVILLKDGTDLEEDGFMADLLAAAGVIIVDSEELFSYLSAPPAVSPSLFGRPSHS